MISMHHPSIIPMLYGSGLENNPSIILVPGESHVFPNLLLPSTIVKHVYNLDNFEMKNSHVARK